MYSGLLFESLKLLGIVFDEYNVFDSRTINKADFIFLSGGDTFLQSEFFKEIKLKELLKGFDGIITTLYNEKFNSIRHREYDGIYINFVGMNQKIKLR